MAKLLTAEECAQRAGDCDSMSAASNDPEHTRTMILAGSQYETAGQLARIADALELFVGSILCEEHVSPRDADGNCDQCLAANREPS